MMPSRALAGAVLLGLAAASIALPAGAVGFQYVSVPDPDDRPLEVGIWYPSDAPAAPQKEALLPQIVAPDGALAGEHLPLVVISHGSGGWFGSHVDTALALAEAGYVVVAPTHTGDNFRDKSDFGTLKSLQSRPRHVQRVLDYMLEAWPAHGRLDPAGIGIFGFSAGGYTALVAIGGEPALGRINPDCAADPAGSACRRRVAQPKPAKRSRPVWPHVPRFKAAVIAAPGLGYAFDAPALAGVHVPVQLWAGAEDAIVPTLTSTAFLRQALPTAPDYHLVPDARHYSFLTPCDGSANEAMDYCKDKAGFDRRAFHRALNAAMLAFFNIQLRSH
ncbi:MAG: dienelactone hydrolase family protein [Proteobacteria bacterium]|nr:dienelactone hydrolase family protein [Pseudomonadota bacterium]MBI3499016.1 dienelactone hydrolase family protein [Pseudomonadota bacterium]